MEEKHEQILHWTNDIIRVASGKSSNDVQTLWIICYGIDESRVDQLVDEFMAEWPWTKDAIEAAAHKAATRRWNLKQEVAV
jgi:hypothetical protein